MPFLLLAACSFAPPETTDDEDDAFVHRTYTAWQPLPSKDGSRLALALEPRRVDADSHGVMVTGWNGQVVGEGVIVDATGDGRPLATVPRGFLDGDYDDELAFVWTKSKATWTPEAPNDMPPPAPYATVTWLDRETFVVKGTRTFDPPLEWPLAMAGTSVLDLPRPGTSDVERDVRIVLYDVATGASETLHEGRGFAVSNCGRGNAVTVAYQRGTSDTTLVDVVVEGGKAHVAKRDLDDFLADGLVCRGGGHHVAAVGGRPSDHEGRAIVLERKDDELVTSFENSVALPAALSRDGTTLLATGPDGGLMLVHTTGARPLPEAGVRKNARIVLSADRAAVVEIGKPAVMVALDGGEPIVRMLPPSIAGATEDVHGTADGGFIVFETTYDFDDYGQAIAGTSIVDASGARVDLPLDGDVDPAVAYADAAHVFVVADKKKDQGVDLFTIDLASKTVSVTPFPLCDRDAMKNEGRCFP